MESCLETPNPSCSRVAPPSDREHPAAPLPRPSPTLLLLLAAASGRRWVKPGRRRRRRGLPSPLFGDGGAGRRGQQGAVLVEGRGGAAVRRRRGYFGVRACSGRRRSLGRGPVTSGASSAGGRLVAEEGTVRRGRRGCCPGSRRHCGRLVRRCSPQARRRGLRLQIWMPCVQAGAGAPGPVKPMSPPQQLIARGAVGCRSGWDFHPVFIGGVLRRLASLPGVLRCCAPCASSCFVVH
jgi:hypothetical protein